MIALWTFLGRPAARSFVLAMTLSVLSSLLGIAPTIIFFLIFPRTLTRGVAVGSVK